MGTLRHFIEVIVLELLIGLSCPLMAASFIFNFFFLFCKKNPFALNYTLSLLNLLNVLFLGLIGMIAPMTHILIDINRFLNFAQHYQKKGPTLIDLVYLCQQSAQVIVLAYYYLETEENLPTFALIAAGIIFFVCVACLLHHIYTVIKVTKFPEDVAQYEQTLHVHVGI